MVFTNRNLFVKWNSSNLITNLHSFSSGYCSNILCWDRGAAILPLKPQKASTTWVLHNRCKLILTWMWLLEYISASMWYNIVLFDSSQWVQIDCDFFIYFFSCNDLGAVSRQTDIVSLVHFMTSAPTHHQLHFFKFVV